MKYLKTILSVLLVLVMLIPATGALAAMDNTEDYLYLRSGELSEGQINIVRRARQLVEIEWTPVYNLFQWNKEGQFWAGTTYAGVPYGQPVHGSYVGYSSTLTGFIDVCDNERSRMYTKYSDFNKTAPYYSTDCSAFVSYCWDLRVRKTTRDMDNIAELLEDQSVNALEVGDCLDNINSHVILVTGVVRNSDGEVALVETMEATPPISCRRIYGGSDRSIDDLINNYLDNGYKIYRYSKRDSVTYAHDCAVPIDGDYCENCRDKAPRAYTATGTGCKSVELSADAGAVIHYTTDGSEPTLDSPVYSSALYFYEPAMLRAIAWTGNFNSARVLSYYVNIEKCSTPACYSITGMSKGTSVSYGSSVALSCDTYGAQIYYTTDGSDPLSDGKLYTAPILIDADTQIRAAARADGCSDSETAVFDFTVKNFANFTDTAPDAWYTSAVEYVYSMGILTGTSSTKFSPDVEMSRGMFITALGRMAGVTAETGCVLGLVTGDRVGLFSEPSDESSVLASPGKWSLISILESENGWYKVAYNGTTGYMSAEYVNAYDGTFRDVDTEAYYSPYVQWACLTGISTGAGSGMFRPDEMVSRQDLASMLYNYAKVMSISLEGTDSGVWFSDEASISDPQKEAVYALGRAGIINGMGDGSFNPNGSATRAQVAQIIMNFGMKR